MKHGIMILKAVSWRFFGTLITAILVFFITRQWSLALAVSGAEIVAKILAFYVHELVWLKLQKRFA